MTPSFVVDCSVAMAWCFLDEATLATKKLLSRTATDCILVPSWWYLETANTLAIAERRSRITPREVAEFVLLVQSFNLEVDHFEPERTFDDLLPICRLHQLTSYDAVYLDLAIRRHLPLATLDESLRKAAKKAGVKLLGK